MNCPYCNNSLVKIEDGPDLFWNCVNSDCEGYETSVYEEHGTVITPMANSRGFTCYEFKDRYGEKCSLQDSSLATEPAIWFGTEGKVLVGSPWKEMELPKNALVKSRMHLTLRQAKQLLPYLKWFVDTGYLPTEEELKTKEELDELF